MDVKELIASLAEFDEMEAPNGMNIAEDISFNDPVETISDDNESIDYFAAVINVLKALGIEEPLISQRTPGEDDYEITWKTPSKIFDDSVIRNIASILEDELNGLF